MNENINITNISHDPGNGKRIRQKEGIPLRNYFLSNKTIGISISESDNLSELGYSANHLKDAVIEIARYILVAGGKLAYGGDMRQGGFTELIFDLLAYYKADNQLKPNKRFYSYLAYPISTTLTNEKEAELNLNVSFKKISPPDDIQVPEPKELFNTPLTTEFQYIWSRCLSKMREEMENDCNARIFIGGNRQVFKGRCPGILEEVMVALKLNHPIYLMGAFGGTTKDIIESIRNTNPESLKYENFKNNLEYKKLIEYYNEKHPSDPIDYNTYSSLLKGYTLRAISENNGLSEDENIRLMITPHINEMVFLIMKGLYNIFQE
jgi:hypothetical protein